MSQSSHRIRCVNRKQQPRPRYERYNFYKYAKKCILLPPLLIKITQKCIFVVYKLSCFIQLKKKHLIFYCFKKYSSLWTKTLTYTHFSLCSYLSTWSWNQMHLLLYQICACVPVCLRVVSSIVHIGSFSCTKRHPWCRRVVENIKSYHLPFTCLYCTQSNATAAVCIRA